MSNVDLNIKIDNDTGIVTLTLTDHEKSTVETTEFDGRNNLRLNAYLDRTLTSLNVFNWTKTSERL